MKSAKSLLEDLTRKIRIIVMAVENLSPQPVMIPIRNAPQFARAIPQRHINRSRKAR